MIPNSHAPSYLDVMTVAWRRRPALDDQFDRLILASMLPGPIAGTRCLAMTAYGTMA